MRWSTKAFVGPFEVGGRARHVVDFLLQEGLRHTTLTRSFASFVSSKPHMSCRYLLVGLELWGEHGVKLPGRRGFRTVANARLGLLNDGRIARLV